MSRSGPITPASTTDAICGAAQLFADRGGGLRELGRGIGGERGRCQHQRRERSAQHSEETSTTHA